MQEKLYFVPVSKRRKLENDSNYTAAISKTGIIRLNVSAVRNFVVNCKFVRIFIDIGNRTIGLQFANKVSPDKNWRGVLVAKNTGGQAIISAGNIASALGTKGQSYSKLELKQ